MTCWALIPIKATGSGKSRLAEALDADARQVLVQEMLAHVFDAAQQARAVSRVLLVGPSLLGLPDDTTLLDDPGGGLNAAIEHAVTQIAASGDSLPDRLLILFADLPEVTAAEIDLLAVAPAGSAAIAPDRHEVGTNALSLPMTVASEFGFAFGEDSFARHRMECERLGLGFEVILSGGLERDVDEPADLPEADLAARRD